MGRGRAETIPIAEVMQDIGTAQDAPLNSSWISFVQNSVFCEDMENLGLAAGFLYSCFWICRNVIYLMTGLSSHPSIMCIFLVDEETFTNCLCGMQRLLYRCFPLLTRKLAQGFIARSSAECQASNAEKFLVAYMNKE